MKRKTKHSIILSLLVTGAILTGIGMVFVTIQHAWITICLVLCVISIIALDRKEGD